MDGEFYFMALGGLGVSLAGFAGIISALDRRPASDSPVAAWRIRNIVVFGFFLTFAGFGTVAAYTATGGSVALTVRLACLLFIVQGLWWMRFEARPGPAWPDEGQRRWAIGTGWLVIGVTAACFAVGRLGFLQILFLVQLLNPVSIFVNTVAGLTNLHSADVPQPDDPTVRSDQPMVESEGTRSP